LTGKIVIVSTVVTPWIDGVKNTTLENPIAHDLEVRSNGFATVWADLQDVLCPSQIPNTALGPTLFAMARAELGITVEEILSIKQQHLDIDKSWVTKTLSYQFYHGRFSEAAVYTHKNHTIVYIPIWKAANNGIRNWLESLGREKGKLQYVRPERLFDPARTGQRPTCVVTAIRDPISHFLSGYNEIEYRKKLIANNTFLPQYYRLPYDTQDQRHDRFVQFVRDFALEESRAIVHQPFGHVFSMSRVLEVLDDSGGFLSGYLPSIANLSAEFPTFVEKTCHLEEGYLPAMKDTRWIHTSSGDPEGFYLAAKTVWSEGGEVARALCILHAMDYACWKKLPDGVPTICQSVYSRPEFMLSIIP
jgi:hypothetical protein